jgi:hypothetical protein
LHEEGALPAPTGGAVPSSEPGILNSGFWTQGDREYQEARFRGAMLAAGHALTGASSVSGTRCPRSGYDPSGRPPLP